MKIWRSEWIWQVLADVWTLVYIAYLIASFYYPMRYNFLIVPLSFLYIGLLGIYVSTKEFDRWYDLHRGRHPGELFVGAWTATILFLFGASFYYGTHYSLIHEAVATYIAVLSVFAVTRRSKHLYRESLERRRVVNEQRDASANQENFLPPSNV